MAIPVNDVGGLQNPIQVEGNGGVGNVPAEWDQLYSEYVRLFAENNGPHETVKKQVLNRLSTVMNTSDGPGTQYNMDNLDTALTDAQVVLKNNEKFRIDAICRQGYLDLRFYTKAIVNNIRTIHEYLVQGRTWLDQWGQLTNRYRGGTLTEYQYTHATSPLVCLVGNANTIITNIFTQLKQHERYNEIDESWKVVTDPDMDTTQLKKYAMYKIPLDPDVSTKINLARLRNTLIEYDTEQGSQERPIQNFNSLNLFDRLCFIRYYYRLIIQEDAKDYTIFPNDVVGGYPCVPSVDGQPEPRNIKSKGQVELFDLGATFERDGVIPAVCKVVSQKAEALRFNIRIDSKAVEACSKYLAFINRALDVFNQSQSRVDDKNKHRVPDGTLLGLSYLCGGKKYSLFNDGQRDYLVLPSVYTGTDQQPQDCKNRYFLVRADEDGMRFLLGTKGYNDASDDGTFRGNGPCAGRLDKTKQNWVAYVKKQDSLIPNIWGTLPTFDVTNMPETVPGYYWDGTGDYKQDTISNFALPAEIDCPSVLPSSVKNFTELQNKDKVTSEVTNSLTQVFSKQSENFNTAIESKNVDMQADRTKVDSWDSLQNAWASRWHETDKNTVSNVRN